MGKLVYVDPYVEIICGDCREVLANMPAESAQMVCTSPPYWGLRRYSGEQEMVWVGNNPECQHEWQEQYGGMGAGNVTLREDALQDIQSLKRQDTYSHFCSLCGAWRGAYGLEPTPEMYIEHTIEILRVIRRVLRNDGVCFFNLGDTYATHASGSKKTGHNFRTAEVSAEQGIGTIKRLYGEKIGLKEKDLCGIPSDLEKAVKYPIARCGHCNQETSLYFWAILNWHRFWCPKCEAEQPFPAIVEQGWWCRSRIIWSKLNPMPESVTDRPTESHEYILMLTKSAHYHYDADAVREPHISMEAGYKQYIPRTDRIVQAVGVSEKSNIRGGHPAGRNLRSVWTFSTEPFGMEMCKSCKAIYEARQYRRLPDKAGGHRCKCGDKVKDYIPSWLEVMVEVEDEMLGAMIEQSYQCEYCREVYAPAEYNQLPEARVKICRCGETEWLSHFATFPKRLPELCILAATSEKGNCPKCGMPWVRVTENKSIATRPGKISGYGSPKEDIRGAVARERRVRETIILGWSPQCDCGEQPVPAVVLDPFSGSGTVGMVAKSLGRKAILIDTAEDYCRLAQRRVESVSLPMRGDIMKELKHYGEL